MSLEREPFSLFDDDEPARGLTARRQPRRRVPRRAKIVVPDPDPRPDIRDDGLARRIREKSQDGEVFAENARMVRAALKTSDHADLAKLHADAVREMGDDALAELGDFCRQLDRADPDACTRWHAAMRRELPEQTDRMEAALQRVTLEDAANGDAEDTLERSNGKGKTIHQAVGDMLGPGIVERTTLLPFGKTRDGEWEFAIPQAGVELLETIMLPGHVTKGGNVSETDVTNMALNVTGAGAARSVPANAFTNGITRLRGSPKFMRKIDMQNQGQYAAQRTMTDKASKPQSMFREDVGEITFDFGNAKSGLAHIVRQRIRKDSMSPEAADAFVRKKVPDILAHGKLKKIYGPPFARRADIGYKGQTVSLSLQRHGKRETWIVTGFVDYE